jgi:hypothetical protein
MIGSLVGWGMGMARAPGAATYLGGAMLTASTMWVVRAEEARKAAAASAPAASLGDAQGAASAAGAVAPAAAGELQLPQQACGEVRGAAAAQHEHAAPVSEAARGSAE